LEDGAMVQLAQWLSGLMVCETGGFFRRLTFVNLFRDPATLPSASTPPRPSKQENVKQGGTPQPASPPPQPATGWGTSRLDFVGGLYAYRVVA